MFETTTCFSLAMLSLFVIYQPISSLSLCTSSMAKANISPCNPITNSQNVIYYFTSQCDIMSPLSFVLPLPRLNIQCDSCPPGSVISSDPSSKAECSLCPRNTYSPGHILRFNGEFFEFNNQSLAFTNNNCYILLNDSLAVNLNCTGWSIEKEGAFIKTNDANGMNYTGPYIASFLITVNLVRQGKVRIVYQKESITLGKAIHSGRFNVYTNHSLVYEDDSFNSKGREVDIELSQGFASILFEYQGHSFGNLTGNASLSMKIEQIEIHGVDSSKQECLKCGLGFAKEGSDRCSFCLRGEYLDEETSKCIQCPTGTTTFSNFSKGISSCQSGKECDEDSYLKEVSDFCQIGTNQQIVTYKLIDRNCVETSSSSKKKGMECFKCKLGQFKKNINNQYAKCVDCPLGTFSQEIDSPRCSLCRDGLISKISYFKPPSPSSSTTSFTLTEEIQERTGELAIDYSLQNQSATYALFPIHLSIDLLQQVNITNPSQTVALSKGNHTITISSTCNDTIIHLISISNTSRGLGYKCSIKKQTDCPPGTERNEKTNQCNGCPNNQYNPHYGEKCRSCPLLTIPSIDKRQCSMIDIISYLPSRLKFDLSVINSLTSSLCKANQNKCLGNNYYGPLISSKDPFSYFFISMNQALKFNSSVDIPINSSLPSQPSTELFPIDLSSIDTGFIYRTNRKGNFSFESIANLGSEIASVTLVNEKEDKGIIVAYSNGDKCNSTHSYQSFIYIKCLNEVYQRNQMRLIDKEDCAFYFEFSSRIGCPLCLSNQIKRIASKCNNQQKSILNSIKSDSSCIISDIANKTTTEASDGALLLNDTRDSQLMKRYNITVINKTKGEMNYVVREESNETVGKCFDNKVFHVVVLGVAFGVLIALIVVCVIVYCKYKRVRKAYRPLEEIPTVTSTPKVK